MRRPLTSWLQRMTAQQASPITTTTPVSAQQNQKTKKDRPLYIRPLPTYAAPAKPDNIESRDSSDRESAFQNPPAASDALRPQALPPSLLEARLHALVDARQEGRPIKRVPESYPAARPAGRAIPFGEKRVDRNDKSRFNPTLGLKKQEESRISERLMLPQLATQRQKPSFRSPVRLDNDNDDDANALPVQGSSRDLESPNDQQRNAQVPSVAVEDKSSASKACSRCAQEQARRSAPISYRVHNSKRLERLKPPSREPIHFPEIVESADRLSAFLVGVTRSRILDRADLDELTSFLQKNRDKANTNACNALLQLAVRINAMPVARRLLFDMERNRVASNSLTWDIRMEAAVQSGRWQELVELNEDRQASGHPLTRVGWTRILQRATEIGVTSLTGDQIDRSMSPVYSAVYNLPQGVRPILLRKMTQEPKPDVDQLLAAIMPPDVLPLDFHSSVVIAHRLVKQRRWQEAEDVVAMSLGELSSSDPSAGQDAVEPDEPVDSQQGRSVADRCISMLHILLEGLVIRRCQPEIVRAYIDNHLERYSRFDPKPTWQTLLLYLSAFRFISTRKAVFEAFEAFKQFRADFRLEASTLQAKYGRSRCLRRLSDYGVWLLSTCKPRRSGDELRKRALEVLREIEGYHDEALPDLISSSHRVDVQDLSSTVRPGARETRWHAALRRESHLRLALARRLRAVNRKHAARSDNLKLRASAKASRA